MTEQISYLHYIHYVIPYPIKTREDVYEFISSEVEVYGDDFDIPMFIVNNKDLKKMGFGC